MQLLAATNNPHKLKEFRAILADLDLALLTPAELPGFPELPETGATFADNAAEKALAAAQFAARRGVGEVWALTDDSGLEVTALGGAPGVHSARYAATDQERIARVLRELGRHHDRSAKFVCVIAVAEAGRLIGSFRGEVAGRLTAVPRGSSGFGYDPIFVPEGYAKTFAELGPAVKDRISHRAKALAAFREFLVAGRKQQPPGDQRGA